MKSRRIVRFIASVGTATLVATLATLNPLAPTSAEAAACALDDPLYSATATSKDHRQLLSPWAIEVDSAISKLGFVQNSVNWLVSTTPGAGLLPVHSLYNSTTLDFLYTKSVTEIANAQKFGYVDRGVAFYASQNPTSCANTLLYSGYDPVTGIRHYSINPDTLRASGYTGLSPAFYLNVPAIDKPAAVTGTPYVQKDTEAWKVVRNTSNSAQVRRDAYNIASTPTGIWLGGAVNDGASVERITKEGEQTSTVPQFVLYAIPHRDCGGFGQGGVKDAAAYRSWVDGLSAGIGNRAAVVVLEPDAISFCEGSPGATSTREEWSALMTYTAKKFHDNNPNTATYMHAGSGRPEPSVADMANRLKISGVEYMRGFAMNVASLGTNAEQEAYGDELVATLGSMGYSGKRYVIDTSRNGLGRADNPGAAYNSCNNMNAALGQRPSSLVDNANVDAFLWIKRPGESDGMCHGADPNVPNFGWYPELAKNQITNAVKAGTLTYVELPDGI